MFVEGGVPLDVPVESLAVTSPQEALQGGKVPGKEGSDMGMFLFL